MAGFFLYPAVESFTESQVAPPPPAKAIAEIPAAPPAEVVKAPVKRAAKRPLAVQVAVAAKAVREVAPQAPEGIRNRIQGVIPVDVRVRVGRDGGVVSAHAPTQYDPVRSYFAEQAVAAARQWRFRPARLGQEAVPSQWTIRFRFYRSGVEWN